MDPEPGPDSLKMMDTDPDSINPDPDTDFLLLFYDVDCG
jgi:hypothetical protein